MIEHEEALEEAKEPLGKGLRYMARYGVQKTLIAMIKGQRIADIYARRGYVEIDRDEFHRLWQQLRGK